MEKTARAAYGLAVVVYVDREVVVVLFAAFGGTGHFPVGFAITDIWKERDYEGSDEVLRW